MNCSFFSSFFHSQFGKINFGCSLGAQATYCTHTNTFILETEVIASIRSVST